MPSTSESMTASVPMDIISWPTSKTNLHKISPDMSWSLKDVVLPVNHSKMLDEEDGLDIFGTAPGVSYTGYSLPVDGHGPPPNKSTGFHGCDIFGYDSLNNEIACGTYNNDWLLCQPFNPPVTNNQDLPNIDDRKQLEAEETKYLPEAEPLVGRSLCYGSHRRSGRLCKPHHQFFKFEAQDEARSVFDIPVLVPQATNPTAINVRSYPTSWNIQVGDYLGNPCQDLPHTDTYNPQCTFETARYSSQDNTTYPSFVAGNELWEDPTEYAELDVSPQQAYQPLDVFGSANKYQDTQRALLSPTVFPARSLDISYDALDSQDIQRLSPETSIARIPPSVNRSIRHAGPSRDKSTDDFLLQCKAAGMSYKDIKIKGGFQEAESTLRGRYRTLTKPREARVRKPEWGEADVVILKRTVAQYIIPLTRNRAGHKIHSHPNIISKDQLNFLNKVPWKKVADSMTRHGCYRYGNATVKKKYWEVMGITE